MSINPKIRVDIVDESRAEGDQLVCFFRAGDFLSYSDLADAVREELGGLSPKAHISQIARQMATQFTESELMKVRRAQLEEMARERGIKRVHDVVKRELVKAIVAIVNRRVEESNG